MLPSDSPYAWHGLTTSLWPIRYKPLPDELLSSWLVRLAHGQGLKVQTFCNLLFGNRLQVWNRDIDRLAPEWLISGLVAGTGTAQDRAMATTLRVFDALLYVRYRESGNLPWILSLKIFHRRRQGFGQQFCPECLRTDDVPYFRKVWRVGLFTYCHRHKCMLEDRCQYCKEPVTFFRIDIGQLELTEQFTSANCFHCHRQLGSGKARRAPKTDDDASAWATALTTDIESASRGVAIEDRSQDLLILRNLMKLLLTKRRTVKLREYVEGRLGVGPIELPTQGDRLAFETLQIDDRHHLLMIASWLMADLRPRLSEAVRARAVRYSHLVRDFHGMPGQFDEIARSTLRRKLPALEQRQKSSSRVDA